MAERLTELDCIVRPGDLCDTGRVGGKAAALARLHDEGLPVPPWIVVTPAALAACGIDGLDATGAGAAALRSIEIPAALAATLRTAVRALVEEGETVAVRSSARDEDSATASFAGQLESYLGVTLDDVPDRVIDVWRSCGAERVLAYRAEQGLDPAPVVPAVLIQRMVRADAAGVAFAADPTSGRRSIAVVAAVPGLGSSLVDGTLDADTFHVDRSDGIVDRHVVAKTVQQAVADDGVVRETPVPAPARAAPAIDDDQIIAIARLARNVSRRLGAPQDIEWAYAGGTLWLLQARPITTLPDMADPDARCCLWDNSNIVESYSGVTTPMTFTFARAAYEEVYRQFCKVMGVPRKTIDANDAVFRGMIGLIRGRVYYNLLNWYRLLAMLPGYTMNRAFMEQMMGVREALPPEFLAEIGAAGGRGRVRDAGRLGLAIVRLLGQLAALPRSRDRFFARLDEALAPLEPPIETMRADELVAHYRDLERRLLRRWDAPIVNDFFAMIFHGLLRRLSVVWCGDDDESLHNALLCGDGAMLSAEPAQRMQAMAIELAARPDAIDALCDGTVDEARAAIAVNDAAREAYAAYLDRFGDRCLDELKLESATLHDDPLPLLRGIGALARRRAREGDAARSDAQTGVRADAEARLRDALRGHPIRRLVFGGVLRSARARVRDRENLRFERTRVFGRVRRIVVELGRRLHERDVLDDPRDVFHLELEELLGAFDGTGASSAFRGLVAVRRAEFERFRELPAPATRFETHGLVHKGHAFTAPVEAAATDGPMRTGLPCCPGVVRAPVRVVRDPRTAVLREGDILVAERTDPGWVMLFPAAAGLLVERGSLLSHSAIVARELGLPTVVGIAGLMDWLTDGEVVEMDGRTGVVRRLADEAEESARDD